MRLLLPILLIAVFLGVSFAFEQPVPRGELVASFTAIETLDPQVAQAQEDIRICYALWEGLLTFNASDFAIIPGVAERFEASPDGLSFTFHLRDSARWSDGRPVTADDFIYAWRLGLMPDTNPPYIAFLQVLKGGEAFTKWCSQSLAEVNKVPAGEQRYRAALKRVEDSIRRFDETVGAKALDSRTIQVTLQERTPYFTELVACWPYFPLPRHLIEPRTRVDGATSMLRRDQQWTKPGVMINNGPYRLINWRFKRDIRLELNEHYWNKAAVGPKSVDLVAFADPATMYTAYASGAIDLQFGAQAVPFAPEIVKQLLDGKRNDVHPMNSFGPYFYLFNCRPTFPDGTKNPLADVRVRKALSMAIDKRAIVEKVTRLHQTVAGGLTPPGSIAGYDAIDGLPYDVEAAKKLLAEAGYPSGRGMIPLEIAFNAGGGHKDVSQALQRMWQDRLGLQVKLIEQEWKTILQRRNSGNYIIARSGWTGDFSDPMTFLSLIRGGDGNNESGIDDPKLNAMIQQGDIEPDPRKRLQMLNAAERYAMMDIAPVLPLYYYRVIHLFDPQKLENVSMHPRDLQIYSQIRVKK